MVSEREYLERERAAFVRHEFWAERVVPVSPASLRHALLTVRLLTLCADRLWDADLAALGREMRVHLGAPRVLLYPDVVIVRGWPDFLDDERDMIANPHAVIEIASSLASTQEREARLRAYRTCPTLAHYVLVMEDVVLIEHHQRSEDGWEVCQHTQGGALLMEAANVDLAVDAVYAWR